MIDTLANAKTTHDLITGPIYGTLNLSICYIFGGKIQTDLAGSCRRYNHGRKRIFRWRTDRVRCNPLPRIGHVSAGTPGLSNLRKTTVNPG